jgi:branched-chain amino acid transport system permease protein
VGAAAVGFAETLWSGYGPILWRDLMVCTVLVAILVFSRRERVVP